MAITRVCPGSRALSRSCASLHRTYVTATNPRPSDSKPLEKPSTPDRRAPHDDADTSKENNAPKKRAAGEKRIWTKRPPSQNNEPTPPKPRTPPRVPRKEVFFVPQNAQSFINPKTGHMRTSPDVWAFLQETGLEYNNSVGNKVNMGTDHTAITEGFTVRTRFTLRHVMHPYHLRFFEPKPIPLLEAVKAKYRRKLKEEPLWFILTPHNNMSSVTRGIAQRRLTAAFWIAMKELGYPEKLPVTGTVIASLMDPVKAASLPADWFGRVAAESVVAAWRKQERRQQEGEDPPERPSWQWKSEKKKTRPLSWK